MFAMLSTLARAEPCPTVDPDGRIRAVEPLIRFATGKATLLPDTGPALDQLSCVLQADPTLKLWVGVNSDAMGSDAWNLRLTADRAGAVAAGLEAHGIAADRVTALGYGETRPIADNVTEEGRARNRRVELSTVALPPAPTPEPPVAVAPAPAPAPVDPCVAWNRVGTALPWPDCDGTADAFTCRRPYPAPVVAASAGRCLGSSPRVDGPGYYVTVGSRTLVVVPEGGGSVVTWR